MTSVNGYELLCGAICKEAVNDYRAALLLEDKERQEKLERFFRSDWFVFLVNDKVQGEFVIEKVRKQCRM